MTLTQEKHELARWIEAAIGIELSTIPPYMMALISIKPGHNRQAANLIRGVMMEEMLHLSLAGNLLSSIGGKLRFGPENIPSYPLTLKFDGKGFKHREFEVDLQAFSAASIESFTEIELPDGWQDPQARLKASAEMTVHGYTIGEFYLKILHHLERVCREHGEAQVFTGDPALQLNVNHYWAGGGQPIVIRDLASARRAIELIITQGEGTPSSVFDDDKRYFDQPQDVAHFFRFREIQFGRLYRPLDDPYSPPTGEQFDVDYGAAYPIWKNPRQSDYAGDPQMAALNQQFNAYYSLMLVQIADSLNGSPDAAYTAILNSMHGMTGVAMQMVALPVAGDGQGRHGAPSFEWVEPVSSAER